MDGGGRKILALNQSLQKLRAIKDTLPASCGDSRAICDSKIREVESWKVEIENEPDQPLAYDMNKYLARATSAILPKKRARDEFPDECSNSESASLEKKAKL